jgi:hypothetical protein
MRASQGDKAGVIKSKPSTDQFRDNYDQINWKRNEVPNDDAAQQAPLHQVDDNTVPIQDCLLRLRRGPRPATKGRKQAPGKDLQPASRGDSDAGQEE